MRRDVRALNQVLVPKGLCVLPLRGRGAGPDLFVPAGSAAPGPVPEKRPRPAGADGVRLPQYGPVPGGAGPAGCGSRRGFPMRLDSFWAIRRRTSGALSSTRAGAASVWAAGRFTAIRSGPSGALTSTKPVPRSIIEGGPAARPSEDWRCGPERTARCWNRTKE